MLASAASSALRITSPATKQALWKVAQRGMALEGVKGMSEHEKAVEDFYFTQEDQRLMSKLMAKVKAQSTTFDKHAAEGVRAAELSSLKAIISKYNMSGDDIDKLLRWKHTAY